MEGGVPALLYAPYFGELRKAEVRRTLLPKLFGSQGLERVGAKIRCERKIESKHHEFSRTQAEVGS